MSSRGRNFESAKAKVNDQKGNPIEIAAVDVWRVVDTAEAIFESLNGQIEYLLRAALKESGRLPRQKGNEGDDEGRA